ncbi:unnamed protein product [Didymodactylos carnosus]|uniref:Uncharacterized protein n=2 Tax=Didymodactylos carnosus TaxID=1234261 RepID=A0A814Y054_9BILA|nr:unnamed protein product [Didymodactylos carnosus]CAF3986087.1 unnamed protein product [Didymodactylos carnosus]
MLSFAVQRQRIVDVRLTDETNTQAQTELASIKNQMLNKFDYLPDTGNGEFKFIQSECRVRWTDGKKFIYPANTIYPRPSFLLPISKLLQYAYVQQQDDDNTEAKGLWNLLLQTIYQTFTRHLENSTSNLDLANSDVKYFFVYFWASEDEQIRETGAKLITTFIKELPISTDENLTPLLSCSIIEKFFQSMINNEKHSIKESLFNECLQPSLNWSIGDLCSLLTTLAMNLSEISALRNENLDSRHVWYQFFVSLMNCNLDRLSSSIIKMNPNFIELCRQIQTSLFKRLFQPTIENSFQILKFMIKNCTKDWIKILLEIIDQQIEDNHVRENIHELLKDSLDYRQLSRLFNFVLRSKEQVLIKYWFKQLLTLVLLTNDNLNEEEILKYTSSNDDEQSSFNLQPSSIMKLIGMYTYELIELLHEKFDHAMNLISLSTFTFLSAYIQQSLPICIQCLLHKNSRIRVSIARLVGRALNMQSDDLTKLLQSLQDSNTEDINMTTVTTLNLFNEQQRSITKMQIAPVHLLEREKKRSKSQIPFRTIKRSDFETLSKHLKSLTNFDDSSKTDTTNLDTVKI